MADWVAVHIVDEGVVLQVALAHVDAQKIVFAEELQQRYPPNEQSAVAEVIRTGGSQLVDEVTDEMLRQGAVDDLHYELLQELGLESFVCVPLSVQDRVLGAITLATAESGRRYDETDLLFAEELGRRAATAIENARLYQVADERAQASRVLEAVADAVVLVDKEGIVRLWNPAAARITGFGPDDVLGRPIAEVVPGWEQLAQRIPVSEDPGTGRAETTPVELGGRELWISGSGVELDEGVVYAFRDLTEERALEQMRSDFVATVSHELRTPLAAIYGAALTIRAARPRARRRAPRPSPAGDRRGVGPARLDRRGPADRQPPGLGQAAARDRGLRPRRPGGRRRRGRRGRTSRATSSWSPRSSRSFPACARTRTSSGR